MMNRDLYKKFLPLLLLFVLVKFIPQDLCAGSSYTLDDLDERPLYEVLEELGETYQVFFSYEPSLVKGVYVDFDIRREEKLESAVNRLLAKTNFTYDLVDEKFLVVYRMDKKGRKKANKIRKKFEQIRNLEKDGDLSIQRNSDNPQLQALNILSSIKKSKRRAAGPGEITGVVTDKATGEELLYANVQLEGTSFGTSTDEAGEFTIHQIPPGDYNLVATYVGYKQKSTPVTVVDGETLEVNIELEYEGVQGEEVIVSAQASGQMGAINEQLNSNTIKNVVSEDRIKDVPDANAAESVSRLPGLSLIRSGGEGQKVAIRGISPKYNVMQVNGVRMQSTDRNDRSVDLNMISPNILSGIEVTKALTADMDADAVGGTVNLKIGKAAEGLNGNFSLQGGYGSLANTFGNYRATGFLSNRFFNDKLGVQVSGFLDNYNRNSDVLTAGYAINEIDIEVDGMIPIDLNNVSITDRITDRLRTGGSLVFDFELSNGSIIMNNFISNLAQDQQTQSNNLSLNGNQWRAAASDSESSNTVISNAIQGEFDFSFFSMDFSISNSISNQLGDNLNMEIAIASNSAGFTTPSLEEPRGVTPSQLPGCSSGSKWRK